MGLVRVILGGFTVIVCASIAQFCSAGAWPVEAGKGQVINTLLLDKASTRYDQDGKPSLATDFKKQETLVFSEHGLRATTTLVLQTSYQTIDLTENGIRDSYDGFGETAIGLRQVLWRDRTRVLSGQVSWVFGEGGELVSDAPLGFGSAHPEFRVLFGQSLKVLGKDAFVDAQGAWRMRKDMEPDDWRLDITAGIRPSKKTQVFLQGFYVNASAFQDFARENERLKLQASFVYDWSERTSYQIGAFASAAGKNTVKEEGIFAGIWTRY